jgi:hypothetical protein
MRHSARPNVPSWRGVVLVAALAAAVLLQAGTAAAQDCRTGTPALNDNVCHNLGNSIDDYKTCYRELYDHNLIPAFRHIAACSHAQADTAIRAVLDDAAALVTGGIREELGKLERMLAVPNGPRDCLQQLNDIATALKQDMDAETAAPDLDAYRRGHYGVEHLTAFTDLVLAARQNRAICGGMLQYIRDTLVLLSALKVQHLDYCQVLRDSAKYENMSVIQSRAQELAIDPDIDLNLVLDATITWNSRCIYPDGSGPCLQATVEYQQILREFSSGWIGWMAEPKHKAVIAVLAGAGIGKIAALKGASSLAAGTIGSVVAVGVAVAISAVDYFIQWWEKRELEDLIADKQQALQAAIAQAYISEEQFNARREELCGAWQPEVDRRFQDILKPLDAAAHVQKIDAYFALSDTLHTWYNELFLWATEPDAHGQRFLDELAEQELLVQRAAFDQEIFRARTAQEIAAQQNLLNNLNAPTILLNCTDIPSHQQRSVQARLRAGLDVFNRECASLMQAIAVRTAQPVPFMDNAAPSDVSCAYTGFRSDVATLKIRTRDDEFAADMTLYNAEGAVLDEFSAVSSDTPATGFPGFGCASASGAPFGTSAASRLAPGTYPLQLADNIYGFGDAEAGKLRSDIKNVDHNMRFKAFDCQRQLGTPIVLPLSADACGIPVGF